MRPQLPPLLFDCLLALWVVGTLVATPVRAGGSSEGAIVWDGNGWIPLPEGDAGPKPFKPKSESWRDPNTSIFVGVSSFRDRRCPRTLFNYYSKARYPDRVFVGVVQQNNEADKDPDCVDEYCKLMGAKGETDVSCPHIRNIRPVRVDYKLAAGPCFGRHMQSYVLRDEEFCMQTDSHMDVVQNWDVELMEMWARADNEYGVLTTYVHREIQITERGLIDRREVPHLCQISFPSGNPRYVQAKLALRLPAPKLTNSWAAGFSFAKCHAWRAVPYDPHLKMVFDGEEFGVAARLWTRGYDMYTPDKSIVGHDYDKVEGGPAPGSWNNNPIQHKQREQAYRRLKTMLHMKGGEDTPEAHAAIGKYGIGGRRTMEQYQRFVGVNLTTLEITGNRCGAIQWVPFEEEWPPTENNLGGPYWERRLAPPRSVAAATAGEVWHAVPRGPRDGQPPDAAAAAEQAEWAKRPLPRPDMEMLFGHGHGSSGAKAGADHRHNGWALAAVLVLTLAAAAVTVALARMPGNGAGPPKHHGGGGGSGQWGGRHPSVNGGWRSNDDTIV